MALNPVFRGINSPRLGSGPIYNILLENKFRADRLVVANLADDSCECAGHGDNFDFACVNARGGSQRNCVCDINLRKLGSIDPVICRT